MKCSNCGRSLDPGAKFCPHCGAAVPVVTNQSPRRLEGLIHWYQGLKRPWLLWCLLVAIVIGIGGANYHFSGMAAQATRHNPWYMFVPADGNDRQEPQHVVKFRLKSDRNFEISTSGDGAFSDVTKQSTQEIGTWQGGHNELKMASNNSNISFQVRFTKIKKATRVINGHRYTGYLVKAATKINGKQATENVYLVHA